MVLAGGRSVRFGSDKLTALLDGLPLLDHALAPVPRDWTLIVVAPPRPTLRPARFVRERPPGAGPAAALVAGARAALSAGVRIAVTFPGDAPAAAWAAVIMVEQLRAGDAQALVGTDEQDRDQPLQLALCGPALRSLGAVTDASGASARSLLPRLSGLERIRLDPRQIADIDTPDDLQRWQASSSRRP